MSTSHVMEVAGKILIVSLIVVSLVVILVCFLHLYAKWYWYRRQGNPNTRRRRQEQQSGVTVLRRGLDPSFLKTIPVISFNPQDLDQGLECAVCLSEVGEGEQTRILPKCNHGFHVECIDMWFHSHSTCPICRGPVSDETEISVENLLESRGAQQESTVPTNVLFWGDETEVSTQANNLPHPPCEVASASSPPYLVIDIPTHIDDDQKSSRMTSLTRILSGSTRFINPFSPSRGHL